MGFLSGAMPSIKRAITRATERANAGTTAAQDLQNMPASLGRWSPDELQATKDFFATNPTAEQIYGTAQNVGLSANQLADVWSQATGGNYGEGLSAVNAYLGDSKTLPGGYQSTTVPVETPVAEPPQAPTVSPDYGRLPEPYIPGYSAPRPGIEAPPVYTYAQPQSPGYAPVDIPLSYAQQQPSQTVPTPTVTSDPTTGTPTYNIGSFTPGAVQSTTPRLNTNIAYNVGPSLSQMYADQLARETGARGLREDEIQAAVRSGYEAIGRSVEDADPEGIAYWERQLRTGAVSPETLAGAMGQSVLDAAEEKGVENLGPRRQVSMDYYNRMGTWGSSGLPTYGPSPSRASFIRGMGRDEIGETVLTDTLTGRNVLPSGTVGPDGTTTASGATMFTTVPVSANDLYASFFDNPNSVFGGQSNALSPYVTRTTNPQYSDENAWDMQQRGITPYNYSMSKDQYDQAVQAGVINPNEYKYDEAGKQILRVAKFAQGGAVNSDPMMDFIRRQDPAAQRAGVTPKQVQKAKDFLSFAQSKRFGI